MQLLTAEEKELLFRMQAQQLLSKKEDRGTRFEDFFLALREGAKIKLVNTTLENRLEWCPARENPLDDFECCKSNCHTLAFDLRTKFLLENFPTNLNRFKELYLNEIAR